MNAYDILECGLDSTQDEIKAAYHRLLLVYHPDKQTKNDSNSQSIDTFLKIQSAYKLLSNQTERNNYNSLLKQIELKEKATSSSLDIDDEDSYLQLEKDFEFDLENLVYTKRCRCGDYFSIKRENINSLLNENNNQDKVLEVESLVIGVECNTCSIVLNVLLI
jgi:DnaJ family protein A protein 5